MTTQTPLEPTPVEPTPPPAQTSRRGTVLAVSIVTIVVGAIALVGTVGGTAITAAATLADTRSGVNAGSVSARGLTDLSVDVAGGSLTIEYGDGTDATLEAGGNRRGGWTFERTGDTLRVSSPRGAFVDWDRSPGATLTLPRSLKGSPLDGRIDVTGGTLDLDAEMRALTVNLAGGAVDLSGSAETLEVTVAGGAATADVEDVDTATFEVAGGELTAGLSGATPSRTTVTVTAGSADITLPDDEYRVVNQDGIGSVDNSLRTSSSAKAVVDVEAALGQVSLSS
ncbi:hypothetical protein [Microbacterium testaceum]|uniref:hypothetical protein n=1 Tax=Microbacterium testaceum TaxID=2033 RepID=UPI000734D3B3|nr:hypothetical protein [Microbacterium testaceum]KTS03710.1 hypothetical protein NS283_11075 [Microbacterium testaceum]